MEVVKGGAGKKSFFGFGAVFSWLSLNIAFQSRSTVVGFCSKELGGAKITHSSRCGQTTVEINAVLILLLFVVQERQTIANSKFF